MAVIVPRDQFSINEFYGYTEKLPSYAAPMFLRLVIFLMNQKHQKSFFFLFLITQVQAMDITSTNKYRKVRYQKEGFDPEKVSDKLYFRDQKQRKYVPVDPQLYAKFLDSTIHV